MKIAVVYAEAGKHKWVDLEVPEETTAARAIELSGLLKQFPEIDLEVNRFGVFGRVVKADTPLNAGDRLEIYRAITADPETVERRDIDEE